MSPVVEDHRLVTDLQKAGFLYDLAAPLNLYSRPVNFDIKKRLMMFFSDVSKFLTRILQRYTGKNVSFVKDSKGLAESLKGKKTSTPLRKP